MSEEILKVFDELGFKLDAVEGLGYEFSYEGTTLLYLQQADDETFLSIAVPNVCRLDGGDELELYEIMDRVNSSLKYTKSYRLGDSMWIFYERELLGNENLLQLVSTMIVYLDSAHDFAIKVINEKKAAEQNGDADSVEDVTEDEDNDNE